MDARGGTELLAPLREALTLLASGESRRDPVLVLVTDGQVGNEDQIVSQLTGDLRRVRVHTVGIDQAVNAGFLGRLAGIGGGRCELVESEDRLDDAMDAIHRRIGAPLVSRLELVPDAGFGLVADSLAPARVPDLFPGVPLVVSGRYRGTGALTLRGTTRDGRAWSTTVAGEARTAPAVTARWARAHLRDLEDGYASADPWGAGDAALEKRIVDTSLRFGVLCRFTAYVAVDSRVVTDGGEPHRVVQPVEPAAGWDMLRPAAPPMVAAAMMRPMAGPAFTGAPAPAVPLMPGALPAPARAKEVAGGIAGAAAQAAGRILGRRRNEAGPAPSAVPAPSEVDSARDQVAEELSRLREATGQPDYERRELLADLASRLHALVRHLGERGVDETGYAQLGDLAAAIDAGGDLDALWTRAISVLERFSGVHGGADRSRSFWKRS